MLHLEDSVPEHSILPQAFIRSVFLPSLPQQSVNLGESDGDGPFVFLLLCTIDAHCVAVTFSALITAHHKKTAALTYRHSMIM